MAIKKIIQIGDSRLLINSEPVKKEEIKSEKIRNLIKDLSETMLNEPDSAGISAPQIGENVRLFIINNLILNKNSEKKFLVFINPKITKFSTKKTIAEEGCLSVRWQYGEVQRPKQIILEYTDENGEEHKQGFGGFLARVIQHEIDHLDGILFTSKATNLYKLSEQEIVDLKKSWNKKNYE